MLPTLYHVPPSFYSQVARLVLTEKGVDYEAKLAAAGPPLFETYAPWYMRLNPEGTVPTLVDGEIAVPDSRAILFHVDARFPGPALTPSEASERQRMEQLVARLYAISVRELSYGSERLAKFGPRVNAARIANLRKRMKRHADMREIYAAKLADIEGFAAGANNPAKFEAERAQVTATLDDLEASLAEGGAFLVGLEYSLADVVWTVGVARLRLIGLDPLVGREALAGWYARMRERPSYTEAGVWERFHRSALLAMFARKLGPYVLAGFTLVALVIALAVWIVRTLG